VRRAEEVIVIATAADEITQLAVDLTKRLALKVMFVRVEAKQLREMIENYYPPLQMAG